MKLHVVDTERCIGCQCCMFACTRRQNEAGLSGTCIEVRSAGGMARGFIVVVCRACDDPPCARVCPTQALTKRSEGGVRLGMDKCIGCGHCATACLMGAVYWDDEINKPLICIHCGYCSKYCPHDVLVIEGKEHVANAG